MSEHLNWIICEATITRNFVLGSRWKEEVDKPEIQMRHCTLLLLLVAGSANAISVSISVQGLPVCSYSNGYLAAYVDGGIPPFTYQWSNGATTDAIYGVPAGSYSVTVTDANNDQATAQIELMSNNFPIAYANWLPGCPGGPPYYFFAELEHGYTSSMSFTVDHPMIGSAYLEQNPWPGSASGTIRLNASMVQTGEQYDLNVTDANGCTFNMNPTTVPAPFEWIDDLQIVEVNGACSGVSNGSIRVFAPANSWGSELVLSGPSYGYQSHYGGPQEITFTGLQAGTYHILNKITWSGSAPWLMDSYPQIPQCNDTLATVVVPDLGFVCSTLSGKVYVDANGNCAPGFSGEPGIPDVVLEFQPGDHFTITNSSGYYSINLPTGTYTLTEHKPEFAATCNAETTPINVTSGTPSITRNVPMVSLQGLDLQIAMSSGPARPGFQLNYAITASNLTGTASGTGTVTMTFDPTLTYLSATPAPTTVTSNSITWNTASFTAFQQRNYYVNFQVPANVNLIGTELDASATVTSSITDVVPANNSTTHSVTVTGSYDPNDKLATTSSGTSGTQYLIDEDEWIDYTIRFQNTGTDTAFLVVITDTLPEELDPATFQMRTASHPYSMTLQDRLLRFMFPNILLPDSNMNEPKSHGFVSFRIRPIAGLTPGEQLVNEANIYFDYNPPVITEPSVLVASVPPIKVAVKAMLGGPFNSTTNTMSDGLRSSGLIPLTEPYTGLGYDHVGGGGGESIASSILTITGNTAIVDWVLIELRNATTPSQVMHTRSALIRRDGQVVDVDGASPVSFNAFAGNYHVAIRHRNHLGCMKAASVMLTTTSTVVDLSISGTTTWGTTARKSSGSKMVLWPGDVDRNGVVRYTGPTNDRDPILVAIGGVVPTNVVTGVYSGNDLDMNGTTRYTGNANDRDHILQSIGGLVPTAVRSEQLP